MKLFGNAPNVDVNIATIPNFSALCLSRSTTSTPLSLGGSDAPDNLALACRRCHERRYNFTIGIDPETAMQVLLFNPRQQQWSEHFIWSADALQIMGRTPTGRATCNRLDLNDERREEPFIQNARQQWVAGGLHPPENDPRQ